MMVDQVHARMAELKESLAELEEQFRSEALKRGFEPAQVDNMALPATLARLVGAIAEIKDELAELAGATEGEAEQ